MIRKILTYYAERLEEYLSPPPPRRACHGGDDRRLGYT